MIWVVAIATIIFILAFGLVASTMTHGESNTQHMPSVVSRILDWLF